MLMEVPVSQLGTCECQSQSLPELMGLGLNLCCWVWGKTSESEQSKFLLWLCLKCVPPPQLAFCKIFIPLFLKMCLMQFISLSGKKLWNPNSKDGR